MPVTQISKEEIIKIALKNFIHSGIQSFTIKRLTELTGISSKTVYKLFGDKTGLLKACLNTHYANLYDELRALLANSKNEIVSVMVLLNHIVELEFEINPRFYAELNKYYPELQSEIINTHSDLSSHIDGIIKKGKENGLFLASIHADVSIITFRHLYQGITREFKYAHLNLSGSELIKNTVMIYLRGICTPKGLQLLQNIETSTFKNTK